MSSIKETAQEDIEEASETRHEISVQSSLRRRRSTIIISIVCGISLLVTLITITAILLKDTRGINVKHVKHALITTRWPPINKTTAAATTPFTTETTESDCYEWYNLGKRQTDGIYSIDPDGRGPFPVYCDMTTDGGGWTVFQRRQDGSEDFYRDWEDYKTGFGNLTGEFWLGNEYIHRLTAQLNTSLYIDIEDWDGVHHNASYRLFSVSNNVTNYKLTVSMYTGDAGDSLTHHSGMMFSTEDRDNDKGKFTNCAKSFSAGWWFNDCIRSNLNGKYVGNTTNNEGIIWMHDLSTGRFQSMKATAMKLRVTA